MTEALMPRCESEEKKEVRNRIQLSAFYLRTKRRLKGFKEKLRRACSRSTRQRGDGFL